MSARPRAVIALLAWAGGAVLTIAVLTRSPVRADDPVTAGFELARQGALAAAWYVVVAGVLGALARALRAGALVRIADTLTVAPLRAAMRAALGVGLSGALSLSTAGVALSAAPDERPPIVTLERLPENAAPPTTAATVTTSTMPPAPPASTTTTTIPPATPPTISPATPSANGVPVRQPVPRGTEAAAGVWRVRAGDCFWTIADRTLAARLGRPVTDREIVPYWRRLIADNRSRLRDPTNPDLIFPGQVLVLP